MCVADGSSMNIVQPDKSFSRRWDSPFIRPKNIKCGEKKLIKVTPQFPEYEE